MDYICGTWAAGTTIVLRMTSKRVKEAVDKMCLPAVEQIDCTELAFTPPTSQMRLRAHNLVWNRLAALQHSSRSHCTNKRSALGFGCAGECRNHTDTSTARWAPGNLPGLTQTIGIVTALWWSILFLARVGLPSCRAVPSPSRCLVQLRPWFLGLRNGTRLFSETFWY